MSWLLANSLAAAVLALLALAIGRWCKPAPAVMHGLWLFVLLKLATPPLFEVPIAFVRWQPSPPARSVVVPIEIDPLGNVSSVAPRAALAALGIETLALDPVAAALPAATVQPSPAAASPVAGWPWSTLVLGAWAAGSLGMLAWFTVGLWRGCRGLRELAPVPPWLQREVRTLAARLGTRVPELRDDPNASSPYVWSFGRACLVLPARALATASDKGRAAVLAHELAHLRRGDHRLAHAELLLAVVLWWHPLFWFARRQLRQWAELAADAWAMASVPDATLDYATVLVQVVAAPDSAVPAPTVLAVRPAARAAFETRLTMILNENVPCRASRAWWLPFASLTLGLFAVPVAAQRDPQDPAPVEIRVNGKQVDELSSAERQALLRKLLAAEEKPVPKPGKLEQAPKTDLKPRKSTKRAKIDPAIGFDDMQGVDIGAMVREGLAEARREIESDPDLRELGITDEVARLIEDIGAGKGIENSLDAIIKSALQGATKMVEQELRSDEDLKALGLTDGILKMVTGFLQNPRNQEMISDFALRQAKQAIEGVVAELRHDEGSKSLGIEHDVGSLLGDLLHGGDFDGHLQQILDKALNHAGKAATIELDTGAGMTQDREEKAPPVKKAKGKKNKERREEVR